MRIRGDNSEKDREKGRAAVRHAISEGINHFDHADIYGEGECESCFAEVLKQDPGLRENIIITSKCGIRPAGRPDEESPSRYDFSAEHILSSVDGSLSRLDVDCLDILLLHRPDTLMHAGEVAEAFSTLKDAGKVRTFGVSNFSTSQVSLLQSVWTDPLAMNQVEINVHNINALSDGVLDQCQELEITPQAWCPVGGIAYPAWGNTFSVDDDTRIKTELERQAEFYDTDPCGVIFAWILKHPSGILPIIGTMNTERISSAIKACDISYSREDWYRLLEARNGHPGA
jgi:predicted oxidoreductase